MNEYYLYIIGALIVAELGFYLFIKKNFYNLGQAASSLSVSYFGAFVRNAINSSLILFWSFFSSYKLFNLDRHHWLYFPVLLALAELSYYWDHRLKHRIRWMWASHKPHHTITELNIPNGLIPGITSTLSGTFLFYLPIALIGYRAEDIFWMVNGIIFFQIFLHTELIGAIPFFDHFLNTPANHRMHHEIHVKSGGCNFGGISVFYDKCFGTYQKEITRDHVYGVAGEKLSYNPLKIAFGEWFGILRDLFKARSWREIKKAIAG